MKLPDTVWLSRRHPRFDDAPAKYLQVSLTSATESLSASGQPFVSDGPACVGQSSFPSVMPSSSVSPGPAAPQLWPVMEVPLHAPLLALSGPSEGRSGAPQIRRP